MNKESSLAKKCNYWIYVLSCDQWKVIHNRINKKKYHVSEYVKKNILENDIIIFYVKGLGNGFMGYGHVKTNMEQNKKKIKIYADDNLNRHIAELSPNINISNPLKFSECAGKILQNTNTKLTISVIRGECTFKEINSQMGLEIINCIDEHTNTENTIDKKTSDDDKWDEIEENEEAEEANDQDTDDQDIDDQEDDQEDDEVIEDEIGENEEDEEGKKEEKEETGIVGNIPIMMLTCEKLKEMIHKTKKKQEKIELIMKHYKYCHDCEVTNNNDRELNMTLSEIKNSDINFVEKDYLEALESYFNLHKYPEKVDKMFVKIYYLVKEPNYLNDVLITFSSNIPGI